MSAFIDEFPVLGKGSRPTMCRILLCSSFFLLGLPMVTEGGFYLFNIMDIYSAGYTLLIVAFFELIGIVYVYGESRRDGATCTVHVKASRYMYSYMYTHVAVGCPASMYSFVHMTIAFNCICCMTVAQKCLTHCFRFQ